MFTYAITRKPGENFAQGITTSDLGKPDYQRMLEQHAAYVEALKTLIPEVVVLDALANYPDAYFVEDTAVVTPEIAVMTNPGAATRKGEVKAIERVLTRYRRVARIQAPGILDGGDVLMVGTHLFVGLSERTNREGAEQLGNILAEYGYSWTPVTVAAGLHLKSSVNYLGENILLITREFAKLDLFQGFDKVLLEDAEVSAANTLWINKSLIIPQGFPRTKRQLESLGMPVIELDVSEARKMDGGLTCMSLRF